MSPDGLEERTFESDEQFERDSDDYDCAVQAADDSRDDILSD
jgi:hypothetical protein